MAIKDDMSETVERLRKERDQLRMKVHLANMEVRDEWEELEEKWELFTSKNKHFYKEIEPALGDVRAALSLLGDELKAGYKKIRDAL
jgi:redox-regulated HSP33 family molecular chaperone